MSEILISLIVYVAVGLIVMVVTMRFNLGTDGDAIAWAALWPLCLLAIPIAWLFYALSGYLRRNQP